MVMVMVIVRVRVKVSRKKKQSVTHNTPARWTNVWENGVCSGSGVNHRGASAGRRRRGAAVHGAGAAVERRAGEQRALRTGYWVLLYTH